MPTADTLQAGQPAPAFTLMSQADKPVSLSDYRGKWVVLYFYPKDDTPGCTTEACEFTSGLKQFEGLDAVVLGVSADSTESHRKFIAKYDLKITLLSDPDRKVLSACKAYGPKVGSQGMGITRSTVLIDPRGLIAYRWPTVKAAGHAQEVRAKLAQLNGK